MTLVTRIVPRARALVRMALGAACATLLCGCATPLPEGELERHVAGSGRPLVVFQSGLGDGAAVWTSVQQALSRQMTTVTFGRAGYGRSPAREGEHSPCTAAAAQREMLRRAGLAPPYVLVGHSLGGLYQYAYARLYPDEVAALVLLDPTHPEHWSRMQQDAPAMALVVRAARLSPAFTGAMRREFDDQARCLEGLGEPALRQMPKVPVRLLVRGRFVPPETGAFERMTRELWGDWARRLGDAAATPVPGSGHYIQKDRPEAVVEAVVDAARAALVRGGG